MEKRRSTNVLCKTCIQYTKRVTHRSVAASLKNIWYLDIIHLMQVLGDTLLFTFSFFFSQLFFNQLNIVLVIPS
ncbi:hypothetical protein ACFFJX_26175 [Pseudarcicella hirudinis]|uniref:hypothetical protein n=1 Tax=Pseudarcicella hirudinis TaxID=1079859 RepID=UPI0035E746D7